MNSMCVGYPRRKRWAGSLRRGCGGQQAHAPVSMRLHDEKCCVRPGSCRYLRNEYGGAHQMCVAHGCGVAVAAIAKAGTPVGCERLQADIRRSRSREQLYDHAVVAHEPHELQHVEKRASGRPGAWLAPSCSSSACARRGGISSGDDTVSELRCTDHAPVHVACGGEGDGHLGYRRC